MSVLSKDRLALLLGLAKVILLERDAAESAVRDLLVDATLGDDALGRPGEAELLHRLALACYARAPLKPKLSGRFADPLADPLLGELAPNERAELFLTLCCGLPAALASSVAEPIGAALPHAA